MSMTELNAATLQIQSYTRTLEIHSDVRSQGLSTEILRFARSYNALTKTEKALVPALYKKIFKAGLALQKLLREDTAWTKFRPDGEVAYGESNASNDLDSIKEFRTVQGVSKQMAQSMPVRHAGHGTLSAFPGLRSDSQPLSTFFGEVFSGTSIQDQEDVYIAYALYKIVDLFTLSTLGRELWNDVSRQLRRNTVPVLITEIKHRHAANEKFKWQGAAHNFKVGLNVVWIKDFVLTGGASQIPNLCGVLQNELFELAWRSIYKDSYVENRSLQSISAVVTTRVTLLASGRDLKEEECVSLFGKFYDSPSYVRNGSDPKVENEPAFVLLTNRLTAFASNNSFPNLKSLMDAAFPKSGNNKGK